MDMVRCMKIKRSFIIKDFGQMARKLIIKILHLTKNKNQALLRAQRWLATQKKKNLYWILLRVMKKGDQKD